MGFYDKVIIVEDEKDSSGNWIKGYSDGEIYCTTRAYKLWHGMSSRCKTGATQSRQKTFAGNINGFESFQVFAEWCQDQFGYMSKEDNGKYWQLGKDIIKPFNKTYSQETCCFVPQRINSLLVFKSASRGKLPLGVYLDQRRGHYIARCRGSESVVAWLGSFDNPDDAHKAWQLEKCSVLNGVADTLVGFPSEVVDGLRLHSNLIYQDYMNNKETIR